MVERLMVFVSDTISDRRLKTFLKNYFSQISDSRKYTSR